MSKSAKTRAHRIFNRVKPIFRFVGADTVVLAHRLWNERYGGSSGGVPPAPPPPAPPVPPVPPPPPPGPPTVSDALLTQAGDFLMTQAGDNLVHT